MNDTLFLLKPAFPDPALDARLYHCPSCARMEGVLAYFPALRERIDVVHLDFARPRAALAALLGEQAQSCPTLVLADGNAAGGPVRTAPTGRRYVAGADDICAFLASVHGISSVHP